MYLKITLEYLFWSQLKSRFWRENKSAVSHYWREKRLFFKTFSFSGRRTAMLFLRWSIKLELKTAGATNLKNAYYTMIYLWESVSFYFGNNDLVSNSMQTLPSLSTYSSLLNRRHVSTIQQDSIFAWCFLLQPGWSLEITMCLQLHPGFWQESAFCK